MALLFWITIGLIAYTYVGYLGWLRLYAIFHLRPVHVQSCFPTVSVVIAVHNEQANLERKLEELRRLEYPRERLQIVIASDGSTDRTAEILLRNNDWVLSVILPNPQGKAAALNSAVQAATGETLVFFDARQSVEVTALRELCSCFSDPLVGAASGELLLEDADGHPTKDSLGLYWRIEKKVRQLESASGSVVGVTGAIYAVRRELFVPLPEGAILDDVLVPMNVARAGKRVVFQPTAIARDRVFQSPGKEFGRKVRTLSGNFQLLRLAPWLLSAENPLLFRFISHKVMRLAAPFFLLVLLFTSAALKGWFYETILSFQIAFYLLALLGHLSLAARRYRLVSVAYTFVLLNVAAAVAFYNFLSGRARWA